MTPKQMKRSLETITEVQMMLGDLPKGKRLKAYNKLERVKLTIKKSQSKTTQNGKGKKSI